MFFGGVAPIGLANIPPGFIKHHPVPVPGAGHGHGHGHGHAAVMRTYPNLFTQANHVSQIIPTPIYRIPELIFYENPLSGPLTTDQKKDILRAFIYLREFYRVMKLRQLFKSTYLKRAVSFEASLSLAPKIASSIRFLNQYLPQLSASVGPFLNDFLNTFQHGQRHGTHLPIIPSFFRNLFNTEFPNAPIAAPTQLDMTELYLILTLRPPVLPATRGADPQHISDQSEATARLLDEKDVNHPGTVNGFVLYDMPELRYAKAPGPHEQIQYL